MWHVSLCHSHYIIKNKLVTAVTTAGLLAGLFGSAFVPAVRGAQATTATVTGGDKISSGVMYTSTATYPVVTVTVTSGHADDNDGTWAVAFSGGTVRGCATTGSAATMTALIGSSTSCSATAASGATDAIVLVVTLEKLAAGASATLSVTGPSASVTVTPNVTTITGQASTALAAALSASKSVATVKWNTDDAAHTASVTGADRTAAGGTYDIGDTTISSVKYFAPTQPYYKAVVVGALKNGYGDALATDTNLVAEVTGGFTVGCESGAAYDGVAADSAAALQSFTVSDNAALWECQVFSDSKTAGNTSGGAWTLTVKTDTGLVVGTANGGFLGKVTTLTISSPLGTLIASAATDVAALIKVEASDAAGRAWPRARIAAIAGFDADATIAGVVTDLDVPAVASTVTTKLIGAAATLDNSVMCPALAEGTSVTAYTINIPSYVGATATVTSNALAFTCAAAAGSDLYIKSFKFSKTDPAPGEVIQLHTYMEDEDGYPAGIGDVPGAAVVMTLSNGTDLPAIDKYGDDLVDGLAALAGGDTVAASSQITGDGYFAIGVKASTTVGAVVTILEPSSSLIAKAYVVSDAFANSLAAGSKKRVATANFGPAAARRKVAFVLESTSGVTKTFYRRANASGVATYTLVPRGTWTVYATYGDEITETVTLKK